MRHVALWGFVVITLSIVAVLVWAMETLPEPAAAMMIGGVMIGAPMLIQILLMAKARPVHYHVHVHEPKRTTDAAQLATVERWEVKA